MHSQILPNGILILQPDVARLTAAAAPDFKTRLAEEIAAGHTRIIIDLGGVSFIDSSGLGAIVGGLKRLGARGDIVLCGLQPAASQMFRLTRMDNVFRIYKSPEDAAAAIDQA